MNAPELRPGQRIHLVGIGGAGLSAIARILLERGFDVSGSDMRDSPSTQALAAAGARIFLGHAATQINGADMVLATSAAAPNNVELSAANSAGIPVYRRREFMRALLQGCRTVAVAGTHGKTTTTSMIVHVLRSAALGPSYIVGGAMGNTGRNAGVGASDIFVIEADEYDNMFHGLDPHLAVVTNIEWDHPDFFTSAADLRHSFRAFVNCIVPGGTLIACADDSGAGELAIARRAAGGTVVTYGIESAADWMADGLYFTANSTAFDVTYRGRRCGSVTLKLPGAHNALNALAALAVAAEYGVPFMDGAAALRRFESTARRFETRGEREGVIVVDDYAHHPTEIRVNLRAARQRYPQHQVWAIWQPHTYSRVHSFRADFSGAFGDADRVLVLPIYAAREAPLAGVSGQTLADDIAAISTAEFCPSFAAAIEKLRQAAQSPALVIIFSAGDANRIADLYLDDAT